MLAENIILVLTSIQLFYIVTTTPVCFNCHCSSYALDISIKCSDAITNKTSYFTIWTEKVSVLEGSDVVLAAEVKSNSKDYCWCTDAKLEWNGLLQNSSGRLLTVHILNATKTERGHYWAALYLDKQFYFSNSIFLNVTGPKEVSPSAPLVVDPKIGALVVGLLFVFIMLLGISIHCWKLYKVSLLKARQRKRNSMQQFQVIRNENSENYSGNEIQEGLTEKTSESHMPLTWDLQLPANTIAESEAAVDRIASDIEEEEGSVSSNESSSESLSSEDSKGGKGGTERKERSSSSPPKAALPTRHDTASSNAPSNRASPVNEAAQHRSYAFVPIKDDRFTTERSWYKSLNTEIVSESLLSNKEREARKEEKKKLKAQGRADTSLARGIRNSADICVVGSSGAVSLGNADSINHFCNNFKYGRSLPTPQPAGARPTVMTVFPTPSIMKNMTYTRGGATIHTTRPENRRHVNAIFGDNSVNLLRTKSVQFSDNSIKNSPAKNSPNNTLTKKSKKKYNNGVERKKYSSDSSKEERKKKKKKKAEKEPSKKVQVPQLDLTPASPVKSEPRFCPPNSRFTVKQVESNEVDGNSNDPMKLMVAQEDVSISIGSTNGSSN